MPTLIEKLEWQTRTKISNMLIKIGLLKIIIAINQIHKIRQIPEPCKLIRFLTQIRLICKSSVPPLLCYGKYVYFTRSETCLPMQKSSTGTVVSCGYCSCCLPGRNQAWAGAIWTDCVQWSMLAPNWVWSIWGWSETWLKEEQKVPYEFLHKWFFHLLSCSSLGQITGSSAVI